MEASSVLIRPTMVGIDARSSSSSRKPCMVMGMGGFDRRKQFKLGFCDKGHLDYYYYGYKSSEGGGRIRCGGGGGGVGVGVKKEKVKDKEKEEKKNMTKKRLKLLKGLSKDLSQMKMMGLGLADDQVKAKTISEAAELLLGELQKIRAEEKELKRKRKEEKALSRAALQLQNNRLECDMSSSSCSESSDSDGECGQEVVSMNRRLKCGSLAQQPISTANETVIEKETADISNISTQKESTAMSVLQPPLPTSKSNSTLGKDDQVCSSNSLVEQECYSETRLVTGLSAKKIEVCMGGKCKKSGAASLLEEFHKVAGVDVAVSACKCMGKCRDGPNVRVVNNSIDGLAADCVRTTANPLCIGVGLEDVGLIVANFLGENQNEVGLAAAAAAAP